MIPETWHNLQGPFSRKEQERTKGKVGIGLDALRVAMMAKMEMKQQDCANANFVLISLRCEMKGQRSRIRT